ncbi:MAG: hypothetical protein EJNHJLOP_00018 [Methanophagales virus PBV082]|uniref:Uncharacterized protein n=1 Tax=Methanophagales virus PBV082 TaxID=3071307 RepID=A0AA46YJA1_9VIRU|nr:MAG: hypothetical protein QIT52_gp18 [Methanophagales virus PBV082]UYL64907.1 MAG: hypothetical protein EJNHJLOP_00018 [Methanophagales virus PBV082]
MVGKAKLLLTVGSIVLIFLLLTVVVTASVVYDDFQNHPSKDLTKPEERFGVRWSGGGGSTSYSTDIVERKGVGRMVARIKVEEGYNAIAWIHQESPKTKSNYWTLYLYATSHEEGQDARISKLYIDFYNDTGSKVGGVYFYDPPTNEWHIYEFIISGSDIHCYMDGNYTKTASCTEIPSYIRISGEPSGPFGDYACVYVDDVISDSGAIVETIPHNWYILRHWDSPEANGIYDESEYNKGLNLHIRTLNPYFVDKCDELRIKHFTTGEVIKVESIGEKGAHTFIYNITQLLFHEDKKNDKYGLYLIELMRGGSVVDYDYFFFTWDAINKPKGTIAWDKDSYASGSIAKVHVNLTDPDFSTYVYKGYVYDVYGNKMEEWTVTNADEWHEVDLDGYDAGVYYAILKIRDKSTGFEWEEAWDTTSVSEEVRIEGVSCDAKSETVLGGVYVNAIQNYEDHETITNTTTGEYNISKLSVDIEIQMNASKTNYTHNNFTFTPLQNGLYEINLYLLPDASHINITPPAVVGIVSEYPFHQAISNATVNIWRDGWNSSTTTNSMGYFEFVLDNTSMETSTIENETFNSSEYDTWVQLANTGIVPYTEKVTNTTDETPYVRGVDYEMDYVNGRIKVLSGGSMQNNTLYHIDYEKYEATTFSLNATKEGYKDSETITFTVNPTEIKYVYPLLYGLYNLTVKARDASTHATIFNFKAILNDGEQVKETTIGSLNFTGVEYGIHKVEVGADGYYSAIEYVYVYGDVEKIVYLTPLETTGQGVGISYPPHQVEFACVDMFGNPLPNIYVEATPLQTTTGAWDWLLKLFGIRNESISYYTNQTLNGTTDSRGAITFVMIENVEYEVRFVNESLGIDQTIRIYPKTDHYTVILTPVTSSIVSSEDYITFNLSYEIADDDEITLSLMYNDSLNQTKNLTFFVYNSTTLLYQQNFTNTSNVSVSYTVSYKAGEEYMWGYSAFHSRFGEMGRSRILRIAWFLDLGISRTYCTWIAITIILFLTAMFSFTTVKFGYITIPVVSLIFAYIGWLPNMSIVVIALCLGILAYMSKREKEVGV